MGREEICIALAGEAGQGIQAIESILITIFKSEGYHLFATPECMSRVRGGINSTAIRIASRRISAYTETIDILIALNPEALPHLGGRIQQATLILGEKELLQDERVTDIAFLKMAAAAGNKLFANSVAVGVICGSLGIGPEKMGPAIRRYFAKKDEAIQAGNVSAAEMGYVRGQSLASGIGASVTPDPALTGDIVVNGAEAVTLGALAGGCNYVCAYPMSPSTTVLSTMAEYSAKLNIIVEQVEDEVGVINMALGAWYAGARAMVTTSGGGFALMTEGISLAGIIESPIVVHLAQRPGPATGLPTRTEQGDLNLALYAGHGEFPRIILAPGTLDEGFRCAAAAFELADRFQVPVFILTDQYFVDSSYNIPPFDTQAVARTNQIVDTTDEYLRYRLTENGLSPRGIPGRGSGFVCVDSDEHDESGHITESGEVRVAMVDKRLRKAQLIGAAAFPPVVTGDPRGNTLFVGWGSTCRIIHEAMARLNDPTVACMHCAWVYPLHAEVRNRLRQAARVVVIENNATGQFARLIQLETGIIPDATILKYDGMPFSVEELTRKMVATR
jgi:2-oxoglutarate ferredoxin oxidoreductase subunit alpha